MIKIGAYTSSKIFVGCIVLTMKHDTKHLTLLRLFVNSQREIAYEFAMGWKHPFEFVKVDDLNSQLATFFHVPLSESLLNPTARWKSLKELAVVDNIRDLMSNNNQIGFTG